MSEKDIVKVMGQEVEIDHSHLNFNEATLNEYLQKTGPLYSYYTQQFYEAQTQLRACKANYDQVYSAKFKIYKQGISDKLAEAHTKVDEEVIQAEKKVLAANRVVDKLRGYLKAWDMNNDNAIEVARSIRKEMDKLGYDIKMSGDADIDAKIEELVKNEDD